MKKKSNYYATNDKYLAYSLALLGFDFKKFNNEGYGITYTFEKKDDLTKAIEDIRLLRKKYNKYFK